MERRDYEYQNYRVVRKHMDAIINAEHTHLRTESTEEWRKVVLGHFRQFGKGEHCTDLQPRGHSAPPGGSIGKVTKMRVSGEKQFRVVSDSSSSSGTDSEGPKDRDTPKSSDEISQSAWQSVHQTQSDFSTPEICSNHECSDEDLNPRCSTPGICSSVYDRIGRIAKGVEDSSLASEPGIPTP